jgi:hypothetical protein
MFEAFFQEVDRAWRWPSPGKRRLRILGSAALMLQTNYQRGTKDGDVLQTVDLTDDVRSQLLLVAGRDSPLYARRRCYLDIVPNGLPLLPQVPRWHPLPGLSASLEHFEIEVLDVVDVVVSKLKRFSANDIGDVAAMIERDLVPHAELVARFQNAIDFATDARADDIPQYVRNIHRIERDEFGVSETLFDIPSWIED